MRAKRRDRGFTLVESLIAIAILALLSAGIATVTVAVLRTTAVTEEANTCQTVASDAILSLANEVRYGTSVRFDEDGTLLLNSATFGKNTHFLSEDGEGNVGQIYASSDSGEYALFPSSFYGDLTVSELSITRDGEQIGLAVTVTGRRGASYTASMTVTPLNGIN